MMRLSFFLFFKMAILSLRRHPIRSGLALLGIVIGIASIVVTMALGEGAKQRLENEILAMGKDWIYVFPGNFLNRGEVQSDHQKEKPLCYEDYLAIQQLAPNIHACTPFMETREVVKYHTYQVVAGIQGINADFLRLEKRQIVKGMPFTNYHEQRAINVAILGSDVAKELFKQENPIGKTILMAKVPFQVIGVFSPAEKEMNQMQNPNLDVIVPFSTLWKKIVPVEQNAVERIIIHPHSGENSTQLVSSVRRLLRFRHQIEEQKPDDFTIWDLQAMMQAAYKSSQVFNQFLLVAASISLVVGGIGVMNIMLVAMTERRREIGIKMALGATPQSILFQFVVEAILLCSAGGLVGILSGLIATCIVGYVTTFDWAIRLPPLMIAFATTFVIGVFFGFYPAYKASKLHPVEALHVT